MKEHQIIEFVFTACADRYGVKRKDIIRAGICGNNEYKDNCRQARKMAIRILKSLRGIECVCDYLCISENAVRANNNAYYDMCDNEDEQFATSIRRKLIAA